MEKETSANLIQQDTCFSSGPFYFTGPIHKTRAVNEPNDCWIKCKVEKLRTERLSGDQHLKVTL